MIPCTTNGCTAVKFFPGICNDCARKRDNAAPAPVNPYAGMTWVEESMAKVGAKR